MRDSGGDGTHLPTMVLCDVNAATVAHSAGVVKEASAQREST